MFPNAQHHATRNRGAARLYSLTQLSVLQGQCGQHHFIPPPLSWYITVPVPCTAYKRGRDSLADRCIAKPKATHRKASHRTTWQPNWPFVILSPDVLYPHLPCLVGDDCATTCRCVYPKYATKNLSDKRCLFQVGVKESGGSKSPFRPQAEYDGEGALPPLYGLIPFLHMVTRGKQQARSTSTTPG